MNKKDNMFPFSIVIGTIIVIVVFFCFFITIHQYNTENYSNEEIRCNNACSPYGWQPDYATLEVLNNKNITCICKLK